MVDYIHEQGLAILRIDNPPLNPVSSRVCEGLFNGIKQANDDKNVHAIIITGKGKAFCCGADIREFGTTTLSTAHGPTLVEAGRAIENSSKPVISAIHGLALGGGLEIASFCHYRLANKNTRLGFPEVLIGLLPGAEGTVRLPRLAALPFCVDLISSGRHIDAQVALDNGVIDEICDGDVLDEAKKFANKVIGQSLDSRRLSTVIVKVACNADKVFETALVEIKRKYKGQIAPIFCVKSLRNAVVLPFEEAASEEKRFIAELMSGFQSEGLRYSFFAERSVPKWRLPGGATISNTKPSKIVSTGVIGAGTMGTGIVVCLIRVGIPVILVEKDQKLLEKGIKTIDTILNGSVKLKKMTVEQKEHSMKILKAASGLKDLADVDLVIEAVYENLKLKKEIFAQLDKICKPSAFLCSNTSTLDIDLIASATSRPDKVAGMHFFAPAYIMRILENVYGSKTSPSTVATIMDLGRKIGKISVLVKTCDSFVGNRTNQLFMGEAHFMLEEGGLPQEIDQVLEDFGMAMGPFRVADLSGLDIGWRARRERAKAAGTKLTLDTRYFKGERFCTLGDRLCEMGRLGRKTGAGWYKYEPSNPSKAVPDPLVEDIIKKHCQVMGIERKKITPQEIVERCLFAAINEGFRILEDSVADKPEDIDIMWQYGFAFPRYAGGPMFYASKVGLRKVYEKICSFHHKFPYSAYWVPSDLLKKLASHSSEIPMNKWTQFVSGSRL